MTSTSLFSCLFLLLSLIASSFLPHCNSFPVQHNYHPRSTTHNYKDALTKSIIFFEGQRSGKLPSNQRMSWRRDSTLSGGSSMHVLHYIHTTLYAYTPLFLMTNVSMSIVIIVFPPLPVYNVLSNAG